MKKPEVKKESRRELVIERKSEREKQREIEIEDLKIFHVVNLNWLAYLRGDHAGMILLFRIQNE